MRVTDIKDRFGEVIHIGDLVFLDDCVYTVKQWYKTHRNNKEFYELVLNVENQSDRYSRTFSDLDRIKKITSEEATYYKSLNKKRKWQYKR